MFIDNCFAGSINYDGDPYATHPIGLSIDYDTSDVCAWRDSSYACAPANAW